MWHITTIEAILGEKVDAGLTKLLKTRVGRILGKTPDDQRQIRKNFDALYSLRSDLVHGNADVSNQTIYLGQLGQAREMARALMVWMLEYLRHVRHALPSGSELPSRETILNTVDMDEQSRPLVATVLASLPKEFPNIGAWKNT